MRPTPDRAALSVAALLLAVVGCSPGARGPDDRAGAAGAADGVPATGVPATGVPATGVPATGDLELPDPDLSSMDPSLAAWLERTREEVLALARRPGVSPQRLATAYGSLARLYHTFELLEAAAAAYGLAHHLAPDEYRWVYLRGLVELDRGYPQRALVDLERALELDPDSAPARLRLGDAELELGRPQIAYEHFAALEAALEKHEIGERQDDPAAAHFGLGRAATALGRSQEAVRHFERALALQPAASVVRYPLAQEYRRLGETALAERNLRLRGTEPIWFPDPPVDELSQIKGMTALEVVQQLVGRVGEVDAESLLGFALTHLAGMEGAARTLEEILASDGDPEGSARAPAERARLHFLIGGLWVDAGQDAPAREHFRAATELDPGLVEARIKLGNALARGGDFHGASAQYDRALELAPRHPEARLKRATALINQGEQERARQDLAVVMEGDPTQVVAHVRYAQSLEAGGEPARAAAHYRESLALALDDQAKAELHAAFAAFLRRQSRFEEAIEQSGSAVRLDPGRLSDRRQLAGLLGHVGRLEEAVAEYEAVLASRPRDEAARLGGVAAQLFLGRYRDARERLEEGLLVLPESLPLKHLLARLLAAAPMAELWDGRRSVALAEEVLATASDPRFAETVAMAHARAGGFERAVALQDRAAATLKSPEARARLDLYRRRQPFTATSPEQLLVAIAGPEGP